MFGFSRAISAGLINGRCGPRVLSIPRRGLATASNLWLRRNEKLARNQNVNIPLLFLSLS
jgi:hypothetical protein